jgi:hypothetical protein
MVGAIGRGTGTWSAWRARGVKLPSPAQASAVDEAQRAHECHARRRRCSCRTRQHPHHRGDGRKQQLACRSTVVVVTLDRHACHTTAPPSRLALARRRVTAG